MNTFAGIMCKKGCLFSELYGTCNSVYNKYVAGSSSKLYNNKLMKKCVSQFHFVLLISCAFDNLISQDKSNRIIYLCISGYITK